MTNELIRKYLPEAQQIGTQQRYLYRNFEICFPCGYIKNIITNKTRMIRSQTKWVEEIQKLKP